MVGIVKVVNYSLNVDQERGTWALTFETEFNDLVQMDLAFDSCHACEIAARLLTALDPGVELSRWMLEGAAASIRARLDLKNSAKAET